MTVLEPRLPETARERHLQQAAELEAGSAVALRRLYELTSASIDPWALFLYEITDAFVSELRILRHTIATESAPTVTSEAAFETWAKVDLFGHRSLVGHLRERYIAGKRFLELTVPSTTHERREQEPLVYPEEKTLYSPGAVYSLEPCTEVEVLAELQERREIPF